ncbi:MAG: response regulator [Firmicutes bacterium]|nr:response regulator [Bacillota bacterium]
MAFSILVVDDVAFMRNMVKAIVTDAGFEVVGEAVNGEEALAKYEELLPDLVLMDIVMPVMDGLTALEELKKEHPGARVLVCSVMGQRDVVLKAVKLGAVDFVIKPFTPERLVDALRKAIR